MPSGVQRGSDQQRVPLDEAIVFTEGRADDVVALDDALKELATFDERKCPVIELRFFGGLSLEETAEALGISIATVGRELRLARDRISGQSVLASEDDKGCPRGREGRSASSQARTSKT